MHSKKIFAAILLLFLAATNFCAAEIPRWTEARANEWYARQPWLVGSNYIPASAINQLEMWQAETFDPKRIDLELGWAETLGLNTMRVFLHDLLWQQDPDGFKSRINTLLAIANKHHIKILFVLFDSCWDPNPRLGKQHAPTPGIHNSGWVQSPGAEALQDPKQLSRLESYVKGVVGAFRKDSRVIAWDLWNEPSNKNAGSYDGDPPNKIALVAALLPKVFAWARAAGATQPLTSGLWEGDWSSDKKLGPTEKIQLELSDVISFHNYDDPRSFEKHVKWLQKYRRPLICTEYMARGHGSTFEGTLPIAQKIPRRRLQLGFRRRKNANLAALGFLEASLHRPAAGTSGFTKSSAPTGQPYSQKEVDFIHSLIQQTNGH